MFRAMLDMPYLLKPLERQHGGWVAPKILKDPVHAAVAAGSLWTFVVLDSPGLSPLLLMPWNPLSEQSKS